MKSPNEYFIHNFSVVAVLIAYLSPVLEGSVSAECVSAPAGLVSWWRGETNAASATGPQRIETVVEYQTLGAANPASAIAGPATLVLQPFKIDRVARLPDGSVIVSLPEMGDQAFEVQVSNDLVQWQVLNPQTDRDGTLRFVDLAAPDYSQRFYRAVLKSGN